MQNLLIIGNGFDLAHGLKTSYSDFVEYIIDNKLKDNKLFSDLIEFNQNIKQYKNYKDLVKRHDGRIEIFNDKNKFFTELARKNIQWNWCDIEKYYFKELTKIGKQDGYVTAKQLNADFKKVKVHLEEFLKIEEKNLKLLPIYRDLFRLANSNYSLILNFNYTHTVQNYLKEYKELNSSNLVHIHGIIESKSNPIVFGYAADNNEARELINLDDKEFMRNIKKHNYKRTNEENKLNEYLNERENIEVAIVGHSCGISDKLILNQIFNHKNVSVIRIFYHNNFEHYFETQVNLDRIMNNDDNFKKLINFQNSALMPQYLPSEKDKIFNEKIQSIIDSQRSHIITSGFV